MARSVEKLSYLTQRQLPEFIQSDYPTFVAFLKAYYEFLEQDQGAQELIQNARSYNDIDRTVDSFVTYFYNTFAADIPQSIVSDKRTFIKHVRDLYKAKGTENAYKLLFRILFNETLEFFTPYSVVLKASDGKWTQDVSIRVYESNGENAFNFESTKIIGGTSGATAVVERVTNFQNGADTVYELFLNRVSVKGTFVAGEQVSGIKLTNATTGANVTATANTYSCLTGVTIVAGGTGYSVNDKLSVSGDGAGASVFVEAVDDTTGAIKKLKITNSGSSYTTATVDATNDGNGDANITASVGAYYVHPGRWVGNDGKLDENIVLEGRAPGASENSPVYYQPFSYVLRTSQPLNKWRDIVKNLLHPAGMALFGEININTTADTVLNVDSNFTSFMDMLVRIITNLDVSNVTVSKSVVLSLFTKALIPTADSTYIFADSTEYTIDSVDTKPVVKAPMTAMTTEINLLP